MSDRDDRETGPTRRGFLASTAKFVAAAGSGLATGVVTNVAASPTAQASPVGGAEPFRGEHQGGIITPPQGHTYFAAFDLTTTKRDELIKLLRDWTSAAAELTSGRAASPSADAETYASESGEARDLSLARLTVTFGLGSGLFVRDGQDRYGLARRRPEALVDLPKFVGDQLVESRTGGDLSVQACADDPQVAFHAVRQLVALAYGVAELRWTQTGFNADFGPHKTGRNLMGFKDGTNNPSIADPAAMGKFIWAGNEGPEWMRGGSYVVVRRIRIALEHWDRMKIAFQEQTIGREKISGAPIGKKHEHDSLDLDRTDKDGNPVIAENAHVRLAAPPNNDGVQVLRRPFSFNDGVAFTAERWPPWRQAMEYDAGLFFLCYQRDPRTGFIKIFDRMSKFDMMNQFVTHTGGGLFACPGGFAEGEFLAQRLLESA